MRDRNDFSGVTERHVKRYVPRLVTPHFGAPEEISEYYVDLQSREEKLLSRTVNSFNDQGLVLVKKIYNQDNRYK